MKKKVLLRGLLGFPLGLAIGYVISIITSLIAGDGYYHPVAPMLVDEIGGELAAVIVQALLCGILGAVCAAASVIWEVEDWSIFKQTGLYFLVLSGAMLPIAYFAHWMERSLIGFVVYFAVFVGVFIVMWGVQYAIWKVKIDGINSRVKGGKI